ncbi:hypothetical protein C8J57DRAFT_1228486 [Mycena rebaudengoi]|nr:hypothetical protein C8J57DRAFT_1228486 [Mycena rebaudengoi]
MGLQRRLSLLLLLALGLGQVLNVGAGWTHDKTTELIEGTTSSNIGSMVDGPRLQQLPQPEALPAEDARSIRARAVFASRSPFVCISSNSKSDPRNFSMLLL